MSASRSVGFHVSLEFTCSIMNAFLRTYLPEEYERLSTMSGVVPYQVVAQLAGVEFPFHSPEQADLADPGDFADAVESLMFCLIDKCRDAAKENRANA